MSAKGDRLSVIILVMLPSEAETGLPWHARRYTVEAFHGSSRSAPMTERTRSVWGAADTKAVAADSSPAILPLNDIVNIERVV